MKTNIDFNGLFLTFSWIDVDFNNLCINEMSGIGGCVIAHNSFTHMEPGGKW